MPTSAKQSQNKCSMVIDQDHLTLAGQGFFTQVKHRVIGQLASWRLVGVNFDHKLWWPIIKSNWCSINLQVFWWHWRSLELVLERNLPPQVQLRFVGFHIRPSKIHKPGTCFQISATYVNSSQNRSQTWPTLSMDFCVYLYDSTLKIVNYW